MDSMDKEIWEGWRNKDFIDYIEPLIINDIKLSLQPNIFGEIHKIPINAFRVKIRDYQPYYKKRIPTVENYFINKYRLYLGD